jgi:hypothetical protein
LSAYLGLLENLAGSQIKNVISFGAVTEHSGVYSPEYPRDKGGMGRRFREAGTASVQVGSQRLIVTLVTGLAPESGADDG